MTGFQPAEKLRDHRPLLLALEAVGWLHMTGKASVYFLRSHGGLGNCNYTKWHEREEPPFPWEDLLKWTKNKFPLQNNPWPGALTDFLTKHRGRNAGLIGLLQAGHAMASGIEKQSFPSKTVEYLAQDAAHMWLSTAFGQPVRNLLADPPELLTEAGWKHLLGRIEGLLTELKSLGNQGSSNDLYGWWRWREDAVGTGPDGWLRKEFTGTLAETRLPNNDVTLFDQSYVAAALFKSAAAGAVLEGKSFPWENSSLKQQTRWRLLTIGMGTDHYEGRAVKIGDWTGARLVLDKFFNRVRKLVEVDLAVGALLYADGEVCVFSFPGERFDQSGDDLKINEWKNWLTEQIDSYTREAKLETPPYCSISKPSRSLVGMTAEIREAKETMAVPLHRNWKPPDGDFTDGHVCPVCLVRRNGEKKSNKQTPCRTCRDRRTGRLDAWLGGGLRGLKTDTIWISELADANDRVALVTMSLDIEPWLNGTRLDSLRAQSVVEWAAQNTTKKKPLAGNHGSLVDLVKTALDKGNKASQARSLIQKKIAPGLKDENKQDVPWDKFYELMVEDRAHAPQWDDLDDDGHARWLTHQLFRKLASPGRIYRFQRQAGDFFKGLLAEFREIAAADRNHWCKRRLVLKPGNGSSGQWKDRQTYNGRYGNAPISLLYRQETNDFLTICNLARFLKPEQGKDSLCGITLDLKTDDGEQARQLVVQQATDDAGALGVYHPVIPLELSPVRFRVLLPLEAVSDCVDRAAGAWSDQFARVWDRLPLRVGVVAFPRMTPFQAVIEVARNIEADLAANSNAPEIWRIAHSETREGVVDLRLECPDGQYELRTLPVKLPDGREDVFYPYLAMKDKKACFPLDFQHPDGDGKTYRHAKDLQIGDRVLVHPSLIATAFMDGTARRFEPLNSRQFGQWRRMRELWELIENNVPSRTALRGAWSELVERREAWRGPDLPAASAAQGGGAWLEGGKAAWLDLVRAVFHERLGVRSACLETLVQAAEDRLLDWTLEWNMGVLKKQVSGMPVRGRMQTGGDR
ncbi:MAG TPA: CRISPR-associated protein Csx11 [Proteobacteria bacterium]|nr:CRISPR-associated protein Csx11 [Pseudomonadota bacterium]